MIWNHFEHGVLFSVFSCYVIVVSNSCKCQHRSAQHCHQGTKFHIFPSKPHFMVLLACLLFLLPNCAPNCLSPLSKKKKIILGLSLWPYIVVCMVEQSSKLIVFIGTFGCGRTFAQGSIGRNSFISKCKHTMSC